MAVRPDAYRFATPAQWARCLAHGFDTKADGSLVATARLGAAPVGISADGPVTAVAVDAAHVPVWRRVVGGIPCLLTQNALGETSAPYEVDDTLGDSPRWIVDRQWLWGFDPRPGRIVRYDRETFEGDLAIVVDELCDPIRDDAVRHPVTVVDIASDGHEGIWALVRDAGGADRMLHVDCDGRLRNRLRPPCEAVGVTRLGSVDRGRTLVLLSDDGTWLWLVDSATGKARRQLPALAFQPCWAADMLATDGRNRIVLGGIAEGPDGRAWSFVLLDGSGDMLEDSRTPFTTLDRASGAASPAPTDVAVSGDDVWFAMSDGLRRLDASAASGARDSTSVLLTPALVSPPSSAGEGWLRAEVTIDLPAGAVLKAEWATTDEETVADPLIRVADDPSMTAAAKQAAIWSSLDPSTDRPYAVTGPATADVPLAMPLFEAEGAWLWLRLEVYTPPGVARASLRELRVLYPDVSLADDLPAAFRGPKHDPTGAFRRLVGVLEATTQGIDETIAGIGAHVNPETAPDDWLDYVGSWLMLPWDDALPAAAKRCLLLNAGELVAWRGTRRGLEKLLGCLAAGGSASVADLTVDHPPIRLGPGGSGSSLPAVLAGASRRVAMLGGKSALGAARLACDPGECDPLRNIVPTIRIVLTVTPAVRAALEPVLESVLGEYVPCGVRTSIAWRVVPEGLLSARASGGEVLDAEGPGTLGEDSVLGRTVLAGRGTARPDAAGLELGFRLK